MVSMNCPPFALNESTVGCSWTCIVWSSLQLVGSTLWLARKLNERKRQVAPGGALRIRGKNSPLAWGALSRGGTLEQRIHGACEADQLARKREWRRMTPRRIEVLEDRELGVVHAHRASPAHSAAGCEQSGNR